MQRCNSEDYFSAGSDFPISTSDAETDDAADRTPDHQFFVLAKDENRDPAGIFGNWLRTLRVVRVINFNAEEAQPFTDARGR